MGIRDTDDLHRTFTAGQRNSLREAIVDLLSVVPIWGDWESFFDRRRARFGYRSNGQLVSLGADEMRLRNDILRLRLVIAESEQLLHDAVHEARAHGWSWELVADASGHNSPSAAYRYFGTESPESSRRRERERRRRKTQSPQL